MDQICIREIQPSEAKLMQLLITEFSQVMGIPNPKISMEALAKNAEDKAFRVFAAFIKGTEEVAGFTFFVYNFSMGMGRYIKMNSLYVYEPYRRRGIAKALFTEIAKVAHSEGILQIGWTVLEHNQAAREFYAKLGAIDLTERIGWHEMRLNLNEITALANQNNDKE